MGVVFMVCFSRQHYAEVLMFQFIVMRSIILSLIFSFHVLFTTILLWVLGFSPNSDIEFNLFTR